MPPKRSRDAPDEHPEQLARAKPGRQAAHDKERPFERTPLGAQDGCDQEGEEDGGGGDPFPEHRHFADGVPACSSVRPNRRLRRGVLLERPDEFRLPEIGPEDVREHELGVGRLPEEEVADPDLTAGPYDQVGVGHPGGVEAPGERLFGHALPAPSFPWAASAAIRRAARTISSRPA